MSEQKRAAVNYLVMEPSLIDNQIYPAGSTAPYDGLPAENLKPLCDEGRARAAEYEASNKARVATMIEHNQESLVGDPAEFMREFAKEMAKERAEHQAQIAALVAANQESALQLAEAAKNMAILAAAITAPPAAAVAPTAPAVDATADPVAETVAETVTKRTRA